jgi:toxin HigB-1
MIKSYRDKRALAVAEGKLPKGFPTTLAVAARKKIRMLNQARTLDDLRVPPANQLEALKHDRKVQHAIRINQRWRLCFVWQDGNAYDVEIVDYH